MRTLTLKLPRPHQAQRIVLRERRRFNVLCCGRRWGKTNLGTTILVKPALEGYPVAWFSPTYKMLVESWRDLRRMLRPVTKSVNKQERRIYLVTGGFIEFWSLDNADSIRGRKYKAVVIDEAAMVADLKNAWESVIRPTLTDYRGEAWFLSTPRGLNYFFTLFSFGQDSDPKKAAWASWQMPTSTNPFMDPEEIEEARNDLTEEKFAEEYLAQFRQGEGSVFRRVDEALIPLEELTEEVIARKTALHRGHRKVLGGDWAQKNDFTVFSAVCADCRVELELDRFNQISWSTQRTRLKAIMDRWEVEEALVESNSIGGPNLEALQEEGLPVRGFETTPKSKGPLIQSLALAFERREHRWLDYPIATAEAIAYESKRSANSGHVSYSAPSGHHDDTVIARALARKIAMEPRTVEHGGAPLW
jgi:hypothetical protein